MAARNRQPWSAAGTGALPRSARATSLGSLKLCSGAGNAPDSTSRAYVSTAARSVSPRLAYALAWRGCAASGFQAHKVVQHLNLPVAMHARADTDGGDGERRGNLPRQRRRNALQYYGKRARALQGERLLLDLLRLSQRAPPRAVAAQLVYRLRRQAQVPHHRNAGRHQARGRGHGALAAFQLHPVRAAFLHQPAGIAQRLLLRNVVREKRHVGNHQRPARTARHGLGMAHHVVHRDRQGVVVAQHRIAQAVAHQNRGHAGGFHKVRQRRVVRREHDDLASLRLHPLEIGGGGARGAHGLPRSFMAAHSRERNSFSAASVAPASSLPPAGARSLYIIPSAIAA